MTAYDVNHTCKHDFLDIYHLSRIYNYILIVIIFRYFSFDVEFSYFQNDGIMMIYEIQVKPFDVLIENRIANVTSVDCVTQLVDECRVKRRKG